MAATIMPEHQTNRAGIILEYLLSLITLTRLLSESVIKHSSKLITLGFPLLSVSEGPDPPLMRPSKSSAWYQRPSSTLKHCWDLTEIDSELSFHFHPLTMKNENFLDWTFLLYNGWGALIHYQMFTSSVKSIHWAPIFVCNYHNFSPSCPVDRLSIVRGKY